MDDALIVALARDALMTSLRVCLPMLIAALVAGIVVSLIQVVTSIQDQTLASVPKLLVVLGVLLFFLQSITHTLVAYAVRIFTSIGAVTS